MHTTSLLTESFESSNIFTPPTASFSLLCPNLDYYSGPLYTFYIAQQCLLLRLLRSIRIEWGWLNVSGNPVQIDSCRAVFVWWSFISQSRLKRCLPYTYIVVVHSHLQITHVPGPLPRSPVPDMEDDAREWLGGTFVSSCRRRRRRAMTSWIKIYVRGYRWRFHDEGWGAQVDGGERRTMMMFIFYSHWWVATAHQRERDPCLLLS